MEIVNSLAVLGRSIEFGVMSRSVKPGEVGGFRSDNSNSFTCAEDVIKIKHDINVMNILMDVLIVASLWMSQMNCF